jgi:cytochrome c553
MKRALTIAMLAALGALGATPVAWAKGDADLGKAKAAQICAACHGPQGDKPSAPDQPILAGQHDDYLVKALSDYKSGKRDNPIMKGFASALSKKDIEDLAAWFSSQPSALRSAR